MKTTLLSLAVALVFPISALAQQSVAQVAMPGVTDEPIYQSVTPVQPPYPGEAPATVPGGRVATSPVSLGGPIAGAGANAGSGTAEDQGYVDETPALSNWELETLRMRESARQRGETVEVFARSRGVGSSMEDAAWGRAWTAKLIQFGVHPDKIKFEASRLTKEEFGRWASRQIWVVEEGLVRP